MRDDSRLIELQLIQTIISLSPYGGIHTRITMREIKKKLGALYPNSLAGVRN